MNGTNTLESTRRPARCVMKVEAEGTSLPAFVKDTFDAYLECGRLASGSTLSTRWAAVSIIRRAPQLGENPRRLHENATSSSCWQALQMARSAAERRE